MSAGVWVKWGQGRVTLNSRQNPERGFRPKVDTAALEFKMSGLGFIVQGMGSMVYGLSVQGFWFFRVEGLGWRSQRLG